jgi:hypothetical protein
LKVPVFRNPFSKLPPGSPPNNASQVGLPEGRPKCFQAPFSRALFALMRRSQPCDGISR